MKKYVNGDLVNMTQAEIDALPKPPTDAETEAEALAAEAQEIDAVQNSATFKLLAGALGVDATALDASKAALVEERRAARIAARIAARVAEREAARNV